MSATLERALAKPWYYRTDEEILAVFRHDSQRLCIRSLRAPGPKGGCHFIAGYQSFHGSRCRRTAETCDLK